MVRCETEYFNKTRHEQMMQFIKLFLPATTTSLGNRGYRGIILVCRIIDYNNMLSLALLIM